MLNWCRWAVLVVIMTGTISAMADAAPVVRERIVLGRIWSAGGGRYLLRWETLGANRDRPREGELPENSELVLYKLSPAPAAD